MNFFAHAFLAARRNTDPAWLVGSMAPDFATMGGLRLRRGARGSTPLGAGIAFHHATDEAFHGASGFVELMRNARLDLTARGLGPGPSTAIGHVGVELLLDGCLALEHGVSLDYRAALSVAGSFADQLEFRGEPDADRARWRHVCTRLAEAPVPERYREPVFVAERLVRILANRPRLKIEAEHESEVRAWAEAYLPRVAKAVESLLQEVESRLLAAERSSD